MTAATERVGRTGATGLALHRLPLLVLGMLALIGGIAAGLSRAGWPMPHPELATLHGPLMVCAFFGTVISLERAVALGRIWAYAAPAAAASGGIALIAGIPAGIGAGLLVLAAALMTLGSLSIHLMQRQMYTLTLTFGAASWLGAALGWAAGLPSSRLISLWMGFLVLTIAGERLELSRFLPPSRWAKRIFAGIVASFVCAMVLQIAGGTDPTRLLGATLLALALWLLRQDVARRTVMQQGLTRFIAVCLLSGYLWLALGGALLLLDPALPLANDAALHAIFVGFVFAMVFGHAPVIFPAVLRVRLPYHATFYLPLILLHASLLIRVGGGLLSLPDVRATGAALNAGAIGVFIATMLTTTWRARRS